MDDALKLAGDALYAVFEYLQAIRIAEVRQTLEFLGIRHIEVAIALLFFLMLQFTKFTAVLLLACMIAYGIFYMWDTWFPEVGAGLSTKQQNANYGYRNYGVGTGNGFATVSSSRGGSGSGPSSGPASNYDYNYPPSPAYSGSYRDARTSALFPPFGNNESGETPPVYPVNTERKRPSTSGAATPIGHRLSESDIRPQRRPFSGLYEDYKQARRDPQTSRRMTANEYRLFRQLAQPPDPYQQQQQQQRRLTPNDEQRLRRLPPINDDNRAHKNRRNNEYRTSTTKKYYGTEVIERMTKESRENLRKLRNLQAGTSQRSNGRSEPSNYYNSDNRGSKKKGRFDQSFFNKFRLGHWYQPSA